MKKSRLKLHTINTVHYTKPFPLGILQTRLKEDTKNQCKKETEREWEEDEKVKITWTAMRKNGKIGTHTAGCGVPDTTPAPEIMFKHAQGAQKGLTATKKNIKKI